MTVARENSFDRQDRMQLDAASGSAELKVIHVEEPDAGHLHQRAAELLQLPDPRLAHQRLEHPACVRESIAIRRFRVSVKIRIVRFNDQMRARVVGILKHEVNVVVGLPLRASDSADDLVDLKLLGARAAIPRRAAMRRDAIERGNRRRNDGVKADLAGPRIAQALHVRAIERAACGQRRTREHQCKTSHVFRLTAACTRFDR